MLGYKASSLSFILYKLPPAVKYKAFEISKKSGGVRTISAPIEPLKSLQRRLANILYACCDEIDAQSKLPSLSHGYRRNHSIITNAQPHHRRRYVLNLDLKDFFPSCNFGRVRGYFIKNHHFALTDKIATLIAQIACHEGRLPQGSPCSPVISDLLAHLLDVRLVELAKRSRVTYSRYADDLTFSTNQKTFPAALAYPSSEVPYDWQLGDKLVSRIGKAGFQINPDKTRMQCRMSRQLVTGLMVNEKVNVRPEYYLQARAMCQTLFNTGAYFRPVPFKASSTEQLPTVGQQQQSGPIKPAADQIAQDAAPEVTPITSLNPLSGILSHIHHVKDSIDRRKEFEKRKDMTAFRTLYKRFLFYKNFVALGKPLIVCEGKTDNVYLSLAIRHSANFHPALGKSTPDGFERAVALFNQTNQTHRILELDGGSGNLKFFIQRYKTLMASFRHKPQAHPVIVLIDNDDGAKDVFPMIGSTYKKAITHASNDAFFHLTDNLYLVKTPSLPNKQKTCVEDLFEPSVLKTTVDGKKFNPDKEMDAGGEYGKHVFAEKVVRPKASNLNWVGFQPLLQRICDVIGDYAARKATQGVT